MLIDILGDVHGDFKKLKFLVERVEPKPDIYIACGDFGYWPNTTFYNDIKKIDFGYTKLFFIDGNHENHPQLQNLGEHNEIFRNVFYMKRGTIQNIGGKNFLFMGGANSIDRQIRTPGYDWFPEENISDVDMKYFEDNLERHGTVDIVISHTCPLEFEILDDLALKLDDPNRDRLSYILNKTKPKEWYFGHWHKYKVGTYENTNWTALSRSEDKFKNFKIRKTI